MSEAQILMMRSTLQCLTFRRIVRLNIRQEVEVGVSDCPGVHHVVRFCLRKYPL